MKKFNKTPRWIEAKRIRRKAKRQNKKTVKAHATVKIKISR